MALKVSSAQSQMQFEGKSTFILQMSTKIKNALFSKSHGTRWLLVVILLGLVFLYGRYDWATEVSRFSLRGYLSSAYLYVVTIPTLFFLLQVLFPRLGKLIWGLTLATAGYFSLPYRWLKLDQFFYYHKRLSVYNSVDIPSLFTPNPTYAYKPAPTTNWMPGALRLLNDMPHQALYFFILIAVGVLVLAVSLKTVATGRHNPVRSKRHIWLWFAIFNMILLQTYLHLSLRSPYVYISHLESPPQAKGVYWYVDFMYPNNQGGVNADLGVYSTLENHFWGTQKDTYMMMIRRAFTFYISSQLSYFFGMYNTFLFLNIMLWLSACICAYLLGRAWWSPEVGAYMAFFVGCGPGFIMFAAQPMGYLGGYASTIILIYLFERLLLYESGPPLVRFILFGSILGLGSLVTDNFAWYIFFLLYGISRHCSLKGILLSLVFALTIYLGFLWVQIDILHLPMSDGNSGYMTASFKNIITLISEGSVPRIYLLTVGLIGTFINQLAHVFFVIPLFLALGGLLTIRDTRPRIMGMFLILPSFLGFAFLYYGESYLGTLPRLNYVAYPGIYFLAAGMLSEGRQFLSRKTWRFIAAIMVLILLVLIFIISNMDAFGHLPQMYLWFYHTDTFFY